MIDGEGSPGAPDLTHAGSTHDAKWLHDWISAPDEIDAGANMPGFGAFLTRRPDVRAREIPRRAEVSAGSRSYGLGAGWAG